VKLRQPVDGAARASQRRTPRGRCRTLKDRVLSEPDSAIGRVMTEVEDSLRLQPSEPQRDAAAAPI